MSGCLAAAAAYAGLLGLVLWAGRRLRRYRDGLPPQGDWDARRVSQ